MIDWAADCTGLLVMGHSVVVSTATAPTGDAASVDVPEPRRPDFVGRQHETALLVAAIAGAGVTLVEGEAGAGKTRLVRECLHKLPDAAVLWMPCLPLPGRRRWLADTAAAAPAAANPVPLTRANAVGLTIDRGNASAVREAVLNPTARASAGTTGSQPEVLGRGIDTTHPDLDGQVVAEAHFTDEDDTSHRHGPGIYVPSTIAGSGVTSGGDSTGVAPDAELLNGKVCNAGGFRQVASPGSAGAALTVGAVDAGSGSRAGCQVLGAVPWGVDEGSRCG